MLNTSSWLNHFKMGIGFEYLLDLTIVEITDYWLVKVEELMKEQEEKESEG